MSETLCDLLARRRAILNNRKAPIRLEIENPYFDDSGARNSLTSRDLAMRRKAEILQYNNTSSVQGKLSQAQQYKNTVENIGRTSTRIVDGTVFNISTCLDDLYLNTSSSRSDVPGPSIDLSYNPTVPLYGYSTSAQQLGIPNIGSLEAWTFNTGTNIQAPSGEWVTFIRIFHNIDNIDSEQDNKDYEFVMDIPIGLYVAGDILGELNSTTLSNHTFINTIEVRILDHLGNVLESESDFTNEQITDISMNYVIDSSNNFNAIQYLGNLPFSTTLNIETLSYYEIQFKFNIKNDDTNVYESDSYVSSVYMNLTSNNKDSKTNITDVKLIKDSNDYPMSTYTDFKIIGTAQN